MNAKVKLIGNRYRIVKILGQGGMGIVYLVEDSLKDNMQFALKMIKRRVLAKFRTTGIDSFKNEFDMMTRLKHPNLTQVYDFGEDRDNYYIVMEYLQGKLLSELMAKKIETGLCLRIIVQVLRALEYIHSRKIVYRDIKPRNIIIIGEDKVSLLDFGLSGFIDSTREEIMGTLFYMSPDALSGNISYATDIYSLGIVFYELLTGNPFLDRKKEDTRSVLKILHKNDIFASLQNDRISKINDRGLGKILLKMTSHRSEDRYNACSEVIGDINSHFCRDFEYETPETKESYLLGNAFAGRSEEMKTLKANMFKKSQSKILLYNGPVGIGKTRLFREFKKYCMLNNVRFFETAGMQGEAKEYHAIEAIIHQVTALSSDDLTERFGPYLKLILKGNKRLSGIFSADSGGSPAIEKEIIIHNITDFLIEFAREESRQAVIYIDDLHFIDDGSAELLKTLIDKLNIYMDIPIFIYGSINENKVVPESILQDILKIERIEIRDLYPLDDKAATEYMENVFGSYFMDRSIRESIGSIVEKVGGNPLFLEELLKSLIHDNIIVKGRRYWRILQDIGKVEIPDNILDIIGERIKRLISDSKKKKLLQMLSLIRIDLPLDAIKGIIKNIAEPDVAKTMLDLERLEIIQFRRRATYAFSSSIVKEIIKDTINNKTALHLLTAELLESVSKGDSEYYLEEIAYHYLEGKNHAKAAEYYNKSGDKAQRGYFNEKAIKYYDMVLGLLDKKDLDNMLNVSIKKVILLEKTGKWNDALAILVESRNIASLYSKKIQLARIYNLWGIITLNKGKLKSAKKAFEKACIISEETGDIGAQGDALSYLGSYYYLVSQFDEAIKYHKRYRDICRKIGDHKGYCTAQNNIGNIYMAQSKFDDAMKYYVSYKDLSEEIDYKRGLAGAYGNMGNVYNYLGKYKEALECYKKYKELAQQIGYKREIGIAEGNMGTVYSKLGKHGKALECYKIDLKISEELGDTMGISIAKGNIGNVYCDLGDYEKALIYQNRKKKISEAMGYKKGVLIATGNIGLTYFKKGDYKKALDCFMNLMILSRDSGDQGHVMTALEKMGETYYEMGETLKALECFEEQRDISSKMGYRHVEVIALANIGRAYFIMKEYEQALGYFNKSVEIYRDLEIKQALLIDCLLKKSEILIMHGNISEAKHINKEAQDLAICLNHKYYMFRVSLQRHRIEAISDCKKAVSFMLDLLQRAINDQEKADVYYELFQIEKNEEYRKMAVQLYESLCRERSKYEYKLKLEEIQKYPVA